MRFIATSGNQAPWRLRASLLVLAASLTLGCAGTIKQAAREAAPAAVKETVNEVQKPGTRGDVADILSDPRILEASSALSAAIVEGALNGLTDAERIERLQRLTDAFVTRIGTSMARSLERDIGPRLAATFADAVDRSLERALGSATEERLQAIALAVSRSTMQGVGEALVDPSGQPSPALRQAFGQVMREAAYEASIGFNDAVRDARVHSAGVGSGEVLAMLGTVSSWILAVPPLLVLSGLLLVLAAVGALGWALNSQRQLRRLRREHAELRPSPRRDGPLSEAAVSSR
jgi:hypothetical protein